MPRRRTLLKSQPRLDPGFRFRFVIVLFQLAVEAITNIRTVAGLQCESRCVEIYIELLWNPHKANMKNCFLRGILFGFTQGLQYIMWAILMWYGGYLVENGAVHYSLIFTYVTQIVIG